MRVNIIKKTIEWDKIINKETSTWIYWLYETKHNSLNPINNILLSRNLFFSFKDLTDIVLTIDLSISWKIYEMSIIPKYIYVKDKIIWWNKLTQPVYKLSL